MSNLTYKQLEEKILNNFNKEMNSLEILKESENLKLLSKISTIKLNYENFRG